ALVRADAHARTKLDALLLHLLDAPVNQPLLHLEVGDAVAKRPADAIVLFEQHHFVAGTCELLRACQASRTRPDHRYALTSLVLGRLGCDPAHLPTLVDDGMLDGLDPDRIVVDVERAGFFARRRADAPGELGEVVGRMQRGQRLLPV